MDAPKRQKHGCAEALMQNIKIFPDISQTFRCYI